MCSGGRRWRWRWGVDSLPWSTRLVARPCAGYVVRDPINEPIIGAHSFLHKLNTTLISRSLSSTLRPVHFPRALQAPPHLTIIPPAIAGHTHVVTTSYANTAMRTQVRWRWRCYGWEYFIPLSSDYLLHHERSSRSNNSSWRTSRRRTAEKSTTSHHPPPSHRLPIELVNHILHMAASSSRYSSLDICLVASWARRIARPYLFHAVVINDLRASQGFIRHALGPPCPGSQLTAGSLVNGIWTNCYWSFQLGDLFDVCGNATHLALDGPTFSWLCTDKPRVQNRHLLIMGPGETPRTLCRREAPKPILDQTTHLRITIIMNRYNTLTHLDNFSHLTHFSVPYCPGGTHNAKELPHFLTLPSLTMLVIVLSVQAAQRGHWKRLGRWVRKTRETDGRVYIVEGCQLSELQAEWEDEVRGGESIWDRAVRYTRDWERTVETN